MVLCQLLQSSYPPPAACSYCNKEGWRCSESRPVKKERFLLPFQKMKLLMLRSTILMVILSWCKAFKPMATLRAATLRKSPVVSMVCMPPRCSSYYFNIHTMQNIEFVDGSLSDTRTFCLWFFTLLLSPPFLGYVPAKFSTVVAILRWRSIWPRSLAHSRRQCRAVPPLVRTKPANYVTEAADIWGKECLKLLKTWIQ